MPDISMCYGTDCPLREVCYRFKAVPCEFRQSYFSESPYNKETKECEYASIQFYSKDVSHDLIRNNLYRGSRGVNSDEELTWIKLKDVDYLDTLIGYEVKNRPKNIMIKYYKQEREWRKKNCTKK